MSLGKLLALAMLITLAVVVGIAIKRWFDRWLVRMVLRGLGLHDLPPVRPSPAPSDDVA